MATIDYENDPNFIEVEYQGKTRNVPSPSGALYFEYGTEFYGPRRTGDRFFVHIKDVKARPDLFKGVQEVVLDLDDAGSVTTDETAAPEQTEPAHNDNKTRRKKTP